MPWQGIEYKTEVVTKAKAILEFEIAENEPKISFKGVTTVEGSAGASGAFVIGVDVEKGVRSIDRTAYPESCGNGKVKQVMEVKVAVFTDVTVTVGGSIGLFGGTLDLADFKRNFDPKTVQVESGCFPLKQ